MASSRNGNAALFKIILTVLVCVCMALGVYANVQSGRAERSVEMHKAGSEATMEAMQRSINRIEAGMLRIEDKMHGDPSWLEN